MQDRKEIERINRFICLISPIVAGSVKNLLQLTGLEVIQQGHGLDTTFSIEKDGKQTKMYLQNLLLEIATVDRDEDPLRFDENLRGFDFFLTKTGRLTESKLRILFHLLEQDDVDAAIEKISLDAKQCERIRIWQFDQKKTTRKHQH